MKKVYDELIKMPSDKLAQKMSDITYLYKETEVPKAHYKKHFEQIVEEQIEYAVDNALVSVYAETIKKMYEESPERFLKALVSIDKKIKLNDMRPKEQYALDMSVKSYLLNAKKKPILCNDLLLSSYDDYLDNPIELCNDESEYKPMN